MAKLANRSTNKQTILAYLSKGKSLTKNQAQEMFGIGNFNACMSALTEQVQAYGNWKIKSHVRPNGEKAYALFRVVRSVKSNGSRSVTLDAPQYYTAG